MSHARAHTPVPTETPFPTFTRIVVPTSTSTATLVLTGAPTATATPRLARATTVPRATAIPRPPVPTSAPVTPPQPPREGGTLDFEGGWYDSPSGFEGRMDRVAEDWKFFRRRGEFGQAIFNENKNPANVHRGIRSQELAFESSDGEAGVYRLLPVIPNHRYTVPRGAFTTPAPHRLNCFSAWT